MALIGLSILAYFTNNWLPLFEFNHDEISNLQLWRVFTSHFYHTNTNHLLLNCVAIVLLWGMHGHYYQAKSYWSLFIFTSILTSFGLYQFSDIKLYVGLSGVLHGYFVWGTLKDIEHKELTGYFLLLGVITKLIYEQLYGASEQVASLINANVAIDGHLYGAIAGLIFYVANKLAKK